MNSPIRRGRFILAWFVAGIAVLPLSAALWFAAMMAFSGLIHGLNDAAPWLIVDDLLFAQALFWAINGFCMGCLQKAIVKRYLRVDLGSWQVFSTLGALLAGIIAYPCLEDGCFLTQFYDGVFTPGPYMHIEYPVIVAIYLTSLSLVQCLALHRIASGRWRWVAAHLGSLFLAVLVSMNALVKTGPAFDDAMHTLALYVLFVTLATGLVMLRMLAPPRRADKGRHDEWAYHPASPEPSSAREIIEPED